MGLSTATNASSLAPSGSELQGMATSPRPVEKKRRHPGKSLSAGQAGNTESRSGHAPAGTARPSPQAGAQMQRLA